MSSSPWFPWYVGDYLRDTLGLSWEADLAYRRLLDSYYARGAPIRHEQRYRTAGAVTTEQRAAVDAVLEQYFERDGETWRNSRADRELQRRAQFAEWGRSGGVRSGAARRQAGSLPQRSLKGDSTVTRASTATPTATVTTNGTAMTSATSRGEVSPAPSLDDPGSPSSAHRGQSGGTAVWTAYAQAYERRYQVAPVRNARVNAQLVNLVKALGNDASRVAAFYVLHDRHDYVRAKHPTSLLLRDAEGLRTQWALGAQTTDAEARQVDSTRATGNVFGELIDETRRAAK